MVTVRPLEELGEESEEEEDSPGSFFLFFSCLILGVAGAKGIGEPYYDRLCRSGTRSMSV